MMLRKLTVAGACRYGAGPLLCRPHCPPQSWGPPRASFLAAHSSSPTGFVHCTCIPNMWQNVGYAYLAGSLQVGGVASTTVGPPAAASSSGLSTMELIGTVLGVVSSAIIIVAAVVALTLAARRHRLRQRRIALNQNSSVAIQRLASVNFGSTSHHVTNPLYQDSNM